MKRLTIFFLIVVLVFTASSCSKLFLKKQQPVSQTEETEIVSIWIDTVGLSPLELQHKVEYIISLPNHLADSLSKVKEPDIYNNDWHRYVIIDSYFCKNKYFPYANLQLVSDSGWYLYTVYNLYSQEDYDFAKENFAPGTEIMVQGSYPFITIKQIEILNKNTIDHPIVIEK